MLAPVPRGGSSRRKQNLENGVAGHRQRRKWGRHTQQPLDFEIPMRNRFLLAFLLPLASALVAQTYVVDAANGPGSQFTDLPTAVAAVPDGATLLVRPGAYGPIDLNGKGMTIVGGPGVMLNGLLAPAIQVKNLAVHQSFSLRGAHMGWGTSMWQVHLSNNAGRVLLQEFQYSNSTSPYLAGFGVPPPSAIRVDNCAQVLLHGCSIRANNAVDAVGSSLDIDGCTLAGTGTTTIIYHNPAFAGTPGLRLANCSVRLAASSVTGGPGALPTLPPSVAVQMSGSLVFLGANSTLTAGTPIGFSASVAAMSGSGTLVRDPQSTLVAAGGANVVSGSIASSQRPWPSVTSDGGRVGMNAQATVRGAVGELAMLFVSFPAAATSYPQVQGPIWLEGGNLQLVAIGVQSSTVPVAFNTNMPNLAALAGRPRAWQAVSWSSQHGLQASNTSMFVLLP